MNRPRIFPKSLNLCKLDYLLSGRYRKSYIYESSYVFIISNKLFRIRKKLETVMKSVLNFR